MEVLAVVIAFLLCIVLPVALVVALIMWLVRPREKVAPAQTPLAFSRQLVFDELERLLAKWQAAGQLSQETGDQLRRLVAAERAEPEPAAQTEPATPIVAPTVVERAAPPAPPALPPTPMALVIPQAEVTPAPPALAARSFGERFGSALLSMRTRQTVLFLGAFLLLISALILIVFNWASFPPILQFALLAGVCGGFWGGGAWLIRRTDLDRAGVGLQAVGGLLVPVVAFSLSRPGLLDLPPRAGLLLASALCLPVYALAAWRLRRMFFVVAGCASLASAVLAALGGLDNQWLPVALVITMVALLPLAEWLRPRAPDLAAGPRWVAHAGAPLALLAGAILFASDLMSLGAVAALLWAGASFYTLAAWLERRPLWAWCAAVAAPAALLVSLYAAHSIANEWLPLTLIVALALLLPLARYLRTAAPTLTAAPFWVAQAGTALALLTSLLLAVDGQSSMETVAITLWVGTAFYLLALLLDQHMIWSWAAALLAPGALLASLAAIDPIAPWWGVAPALLALGYVGLALALEPPVRANVLAAYVGAAVLALLSGVMMYDSPVTARWSLPLLIGGLLALPLAYERGRMVWLAERPRLLTATFGLAAAAVLLAAWLTALLRLTALQPAERGLALMPLAAIYLIGAARWPGRLRRSYDLALQFVGVGLALAGATLAYLPGGYVTYLLTALAAIWLFQAIRHHHSLWAFITLGTALASGGSWLLLSNSPYTPQDLVMLWLAFAALYLIGGAVLSRTSWRFWSLPALGWGAITVALALIWIGGNSQGATGLQAWHRLGVLALAAIIAVSGALWKADWPGFVVALLLAYATLLAARRGFFTGWQPLDADFGYVLCTITLGLALIGQALRRIEQRYAYPYEIVGFAILTLAPLPAIGDAQHATLVWAAMLILYALAGWLYGLRWASAPALLALDMTILHGSAWLIPGGRPAGASLLLLGAAWLQGLLGLWWSRGASAPKAKFSIVNFQPAYAVALISGAGALAIGSRADDALAIVGFGLAGLLALVSTRHRQLGGAWATLGLLVTGFAALHRFWGTGLLWSMAWGVAEALALCLLGWAIEPRTANQGLRTNSVFPDLGARFSALSIWRQPLADGPLAAGVLLTLGLLANAVPRGDLPPLTFALATLAVLLATLAVRREPAFAYGAGAALIAAGLCQLYDWGFRQPQWFVIPAGLYLLALAAGLRRFQGRRQLAQLIETGAIMLLLGVTSGQSLRAEGLESQVYAAGMCVEALLLLGYGVLARLRAPFLGGAAFFVAGVLWLSVDPLMALNKWVLLGLLGLLLVGVYVLLERRQQELTRAGRALIDTVSSWR